MLLQRILMYTLQGLSSCVNKQRSCLNRPRLRLNKLSFHLNKLSLHFIKLSSRLNKVFPVFHDLLRINKLIIICFIIALLCCALMLDKLLQDCDAVALIRLRLRKLRSRLHKLFPFLQESHLYVAMKLHVCNALCIILHFKSSL